MRKLLAFVLTLLLAFFLNGCGGEQNTGDSTTKSTENSNQTTIDITDMDGLYNFVNAEIYQVSREDFDSLFEISFIDVTNDGFDEAVIVNNADWSANIEIVMVNGTQYKNIKTDVQVQKYKNELRMQDGFLKVIQASGGTGIYVEVMSLLKYDNGRMITVLNNLELSSNESNPPDWSCEHNAQINGPLTNFEYILTKDDNGVQSEERNQYTYNKDTLSFEVKDIPDMESEQKVEKEKIVDPKNIAIKNYDGEGLERLSKIEVDTNDEYVSIKGEVRDTLAIFGEVTDVKVEYIVLYTEGNQYLLEEFDSLKNVELTIPINNNPDELITVSFYDKGFRKHIFACTTNKRDDYIYCDAEEVQELNPSLEEKYQKTTSYEDKSDLIVNYLGLSVKDFLGSNNFNNIQEEIDEYEGDIFYRVVNEPLGNDLIINQLNNNIYRIFIMPNENYESMEDDAKYSFLGVDFDMPIYQARYNLDKSNDNIIIELSEDYEGKGKLAGINVKLDLSK